MGSHVVFEILFGELEHEGETRLRVNDVVQPAKARLTEGPRTEATRLRTATKSYQHDTEQH